MNRALGLVRRGRIILAQSYLEPGDLRARGFVLGSYLLIKGSHTFINLDIGQSAQWFPEYGLELGPALAPAPASIAALRRANGLYVRRYENGTVVVNPEGQAHLFRLAGPARLVQPVGGGALNAAADTRGWGLRERVVRGSVLVPAHAGLVLL